MVRDETAVLPMLPVFRRVHVAEVGRMRRVSAVAIGVGLGTSLLDSDRLRVVDQGPLSVGTQIGMLRNETDIGMPGDRLEEHKVGPFIPIDRRLVSKEIPSFPRTAMLDLERRIVDVQGVKSE